MKLMIEKMPEGANIKRTKYRKGNHLPGRKAAKPKTDGTYIKEKSIKRKQAKQNFFWLILRDDNEYRVPKIAKKRRIEYPALLKNMDPGE